MARRRRFARPRPRIAAPPPQIDRITQANFSVVLNAPASILHVGFGDYVRVPPNALAFFPKEHPGLRFGHFSRITSPYPGWLMTYVGSLFAAESAPPTEPRDGYYLFVRGKATAFSEGVAGFDGNDAAATLLASLFTDSNPLANGLEYWATKSGKLLIETFDKVLKAPIARPETALPKAVPLDPYEVLGLRRDCSTEDLKAAYRELIRLYHPDQVARLGKEIQRVAEERTQAINSAREAIEQELSKGQRQA